MEDITGGDYKHTRRIWDDFGMKNLGQYNDLHAQSDTLYLADPFKGFRKKNLLPIEMKKIKKKSKCI